MIALLLWAGCVPTLVDLDGDGVAGHLDCDDTDPDVHPGAVERCDDGIDNDCDGADEACGPPTADLWPDPLPPGFHRFVADMDHVMFGGAILLMPSGELVVGAHRYGDLEQDQAAGGGVFFIEPPTTTSGELEVGAKQTENAGVFDLWQGAPGDLVGESLAAGTGACEGLLSVGSRSFGLHVLDRTSELEVPAAIPGGGGGADYAASMAVLSDCEVAVGYPRYLGNGAVALIELDVVSGGVLFPNASTWRLVYDDVAATYDSTSLGQAVAAADLDGDGLRELVIGDPDFGPQTGRVVVLSGTDVAGMSPIGPNEFHLIDTEGAKHYKPLLMLDGEPGSKLGIDLVTGPPDWQGCDLFGEPSDVQHVLALASVQDDLERGIANASAWRLLTSLGGDTLDILGEAPADEDCHAAAVEDFNGDRILDLAVGGCWDAARAGLVYLFAGPLPRDATVLRTLEDADLVLSDGRSPTGANAGSALAARRRDPTGPADLLVGAPFYGQPEALSAPKEPGAVYLVPGSYLQPLLPAGSCAR